MLKKSLETQWGNYSTAGKGNIFLNNCALPKHTHGHEVSQFVRGQSVRGLL